MEKLENFLNDVQKLNTPKEIDDCASRFSHKIIKSSWRISYLHLNKSSLEKIGYSVRLFKCDFKKEMSWFINIGYEPYPFSKFFFSKDKKEFIFTEHISLYYADTIECSQEMLDINEFRQIVINEVTSLYNKQLALKEFVDSIINKHLDYVKQQEQQSLYDHIIEEAIEKAKKDGIIPPNFEKNIEMGF